MQQLDEERNVFTFVTAPGVATRTLEATNVASAAQGEMYMVPGYNQAVIIFEGLAPLEDGKVYQFWLANSAGQVAAGPPVMVDADGITRIVIEAPREVNAYTTVMLTVEDATIPHPQPSNDVVLEGSL